MRKGLLLFWGQFLTKIPFWLFMWRVWIVKTSDFITKMFSRSEHLLKRSRCLRQMPLAVLFGWGGGILLLDVVLRALTSIRCEQEGSLCIFLSVCRMTSHLNGRMLQSNMRRNQCTWEDGVHLHLLWMRGQKCRPVCTWAGNTKVMWKLSLWTDRCRWVPWKMFRARGWSLVPC